MQKRHWLVAQLAIIAGFVSGHTGDGAKTVLPGESLIKINFRLVPKMDPKKQVM